MDFGSLDIVISDEHSVLLLRLVYAEYPESFLEKLPGTVAHHMPVIPVTFEAGAGKLQVPSQIQSQVLFSKLKKKGLGLGM